MHWIALALVVCTGMGLYFVERIARLFLEHQQTRDDRRMQLEEQVKLAPPKKAVLPPDLAMIADQENEPWARDQVRAAIQDEYEATGDWDDVRNRLLGAR